MGRSLKKGPFADAHLLKKIDALNASGQRLIQFDIAGQICPGVFGQLQSLHRCRAVKPARPQHQGIQKEIVLLRKD